MMTLARNLMRRAGRYFLAGVFAVLPLAITVAIVIWVADFVRRFVGPDTAGGGGLRRLGLRFASDDAIAYAIGAVIVLACVFALGVAAESGARNLMQRL